VFRSVYRGLIICLLASFMVVLFATPALAFDGRGGETVTVPSGEVVEGDLYLGGGDIIVDGTVNGDLFGAGRSLTINGEVNGGISFAGQTITLNGNVGNGARIAGQSITINGNIGRDLFAAGSDLTISNQSVVKGDLVLGAGTARIIGRIDGDIKGSVGVATITHLVGGSVHLKVDKLTVTSSAKIQGNLTYTSKNQATVQSGAIIKGTTTLKLPEPTPSILPVLAGVAVVWQVLAFLMILIIGIIVILIASRRVTSLADSVQARPWQSLGWGAVILIMTPIAAIIVMITVIGLPLGLISLVLYGIALYLAQIPIALLIGRLIIRQNRELGSKGMMIGALALGLVILFLLRLIPFVGWIVGLLTIVFGLGSLITAYRRNIKVYTA
jgi:hypothetical protein